MFIFIWFMIFFLNFFYKIWTNDSWGETIVSYPYHYYTTSKLRDLLPRLDTCTSLGNKVLSASDIVYKYTCTCGQVYIGETKRRLSVRISEHSKPKSPMMEHITHCEGAQFTDNNFSIVARGQRGRESRKRYESLWIRYYDRRSLAFNVCERSRELIIF